MRRWIKKPNGLVWHEGLHGGSENQRHATTVCMKIVRDPVSRYNAPAPSETCPACSQLLRQRDTGYLTRRDRNRLRRR